MCAESTRKWQELVICLHRALSTQNSMFLLKQDGMAESRYPALDRKGLDLEKQPCNDRKADHVCVSHRDLIVLNSFSRDPREAS